MPRGRSRRAQPWTSLRGNRRRVRRAQPPAAGAESGDGQRGLTRKTHRGREARTVSPSPPARANAYSDKIDSDVDILRAYSEGGETLGRLHRATRSGESRFVTLLEIARGGRLRPRASLPLLAPATKKVRQRSISLTATARVPEKHASEEESRCRPHQEDDAGGRRSREDRAGNPGARVYVLGPPRYPEKSDSRRDFPS